MTFVVAQMGADTKNVDEQWFEGKRKYTDYYTIIWLQLVAMIRHDYTAIDLISIYNLKISGIVSYNY